MDGNVDLEERHRVFTKLPPMEEIKDGRYFKMIFDFMWTSVFKLYGTASMRTAMESSQGSGQMDLVRISDFAYVVVMIENKKKVWERQARMKGMLPEEKKRLKESGDYVEEDRNSQVVGEGSTNTLGVDGTRKGRC